MNYGSQAVPNAVAYAPVDVRAAFIRKVYNLFFLSILVTVGVGSYCAQPTVAPGLLRMTTVLFIGWFLCFLALSFTRRTSGLNLFLFYLFAAIEGAIAGPVLWMVSQTHPGVAADAAWITLAVFGGLSMYAIQSRKDFNYLGGMLFVGIIALVVTGIATIFIHIALLNTLYCLFGILLFSGFILYDTSQIQLRLGPDDAILGALSLYLDLVNLFWLILNLLSSRDRN